MVLCCKRVVVVLDSLEILLLAAVLLLVSCHRTGLPCHEAELLVPLGLGHLQQLLEFLDPVRVSGLNGQAGHQQQQKDIHSNGKTDTQRQKARHTTTERHTHTNR